jgi:hypothetical protein
MVELLALSKLELLKEKCDDDSEKPAAVFYVYCVCIVIVNALNLIQSDLSNDTLRTT